MDHDHETCPQDQPVVSKMISIEIDILILISRGELSPTQQGQLSKILNEKIDWQALYQLAMRHRVLPLLYHHLNNTGIAPLVPPSILEQLKGACRQTGFRNLTMTGSLLTVLKTLKDHGIEAVPFKGPTLSETLFGDSKFRIYSDLDILIHPEDLHDGLSVLAILGFLPKTSLSKQQLHKLATTDNELPLVNDKTNIVIDLQWELTGNYFSEKITLSSLRANLTQRNFASSQIKTIGNEDYLLYLCLHGNQHMWVTLDHICCVAELLKKCPELNWQSLFCKAKKLKVYRILFIGLLLAKWLHPNLSIERLNKVDQKTIQIVESIKEDHLFPATDCIDNINRRFTCYHMHTMDNISFSIKYMLYLLKPTREDWQSLPLPPALSPLYYLLRPFRLLWNLIAKNR